MNRAIRSYVLALLALAMAGAVGLIGWRFNSDIEHAQAHAALGSVLLQTRCGPIEYLRELWKQQPETNFLLVGRDKAPVVHHRSTKSAHQIS